MLRLFGRVTGAQFVRSAHKAERWLLAGVLIVMLHLTAVQIPDLQLFGARLWAQDGDLVRSIEQQRGGRHWVDQKTDPPR